MKQIAIILATALLLSCNDNPEKTIVNEGVLPDSSTTNSIDSVIVKKQCYRNLNKGDSIVLHLSIVNNIVTGDMYYQIGGKDKNKGILDGEMRGDTLFADYTFQSEGIESARQVAFLLKGDQLLEGYGDAKEKEHKMVFTNTGDLTFGKGIILQKSVCP